MKKIKNIYIAIIALCTYSCNDFLDSKPISSESEDSFYKTDEQMFKALIAAYDVLGWTSHFPFANNIPFSEIRSDNANAGGGTPRDNVFIQDMEIFKNTSHCEIARNIWKKDYAGIYKANLVINAEFDSDLTKLYKAEALFLRAWFHFDLLRTYGPCPINLETTYPADYHFMRESRENVNKQIEADLLAAIPYLKEKHEDSMVGRITKGAARALLGKVYIDWTNDNKELFDKAAEQLKLVISSGQYYLFTEYDKLFASHQENNSESIFEIQHTTTSGWSNGNADLKLTGMEGNDWIKRVGMRNLMNSILYLDGYGFMLPRKELYYYFIPEDKIRRDACMMSPDDVLKEEKAAGNNNIVWDVSGYNQEDWEGFVSKKYTIYKDYEIVGNQNLNLPGNERMIRYGEVYLLLAEAYLRGTGKYGSESDAIALIDELRMYHLGKGGSNPYLTVADLKQKYPDRFKTTMDILWYERRCELAGEGDRWYDIVRSGRAPEIMKPRFPEDFDEEDIYIPISFQEITASGGSLTEYPDPEDRAGLYTE